ncbi:SDR family oxidoreductase [Nakamurella sp. YIM 132087]|uniref:SDR family oxidoreductase n=1 Tax=Nakamurella alba TaxID=2665158 RepID=A0A7K1FWS4_9ACTN|nr:SDR family oxidoreductase [Nakamurella alba]MTD17274.1 SDR family oxidoreductase [Nakamurella alba]
MTARPATILVTGAAGGLGAAVASLLRSQGDRVVAGDLTPPTGPDPLTLDVTDESAWAAAVPAILDRYGPLDGLVHAAGVAARRPLLETTVAEFERTLRVNTLGTFLALRSAPALMPTGGSVVTFSSINGLIGTEGIGAYCASKFAVRGLTRTAAVEFADLGIRVNTICPGPIETSMVHGSSFADVDQDAYLASIPLRRRGRPEEVAGMVRYLLGPDAGYVTGAEFVIDGGLLGGRRVPDAARAG